MNKDYTEALGSLLELTFGGGSAARSDAALQSAIAPLLALGCRQHRLGSGKTFVHSGFAVYSVFVLLRGSARVICYSAAGAASVQDSLAAPQMFGLIEVVEERLMFAASVQANTDVLVLEVPAALFRSVLQNSTPAARVVIRNLAFLAVRNMDNVEYYTLNRPQQTLALYLYQACKDAKKPYALPLCRRMLAEILHIHLRSLYRYLDELKDKGLCCVIRGKITITEQQFVALQQFCAGLEQP